MTRKIIKIASLLLVVLAITSCGNPSTNTLSAAQKLIKISCVEPDDGQTITALEIFKEKIQYYSSDMVATYDISPHPIFDVINGDAQIAIVETKNLGEYGRDFQMLSSPFFFDSALQSTMTTNSNDFKDIFDQYFIDKTSCKYLSSVYLSSEVIASNSEYLSSVGDFDKKAVAIKKSDGFAKDIFSRFNAEITEVDDKKYFEYVNSQDMVIFNFNLSQPESLDIKASKSSIYVVDKPLYVNAQWVLINNEYWEGLSQNLKYKLLQALSYFNAACEEPRLAEQDELFYTYAHNKTNLVKTSGNSIKSDVQSYIKFSEEYGKKWDMTKYNDTILIIK
ncbi:MAG: hypothetical protein RSD67_06095 [Oscillospiraceae bacterium]